ETAADVRKITASAAALQQQVLGVAAGQRQALDGQAKTIAALKGEVAKLEIKNHALSGDLASMQTVVPSLSSDLGLVVEMLAELKTAQPPPAPQIPLAPQPAPTVMPSVPEIPTTYAALTITVHPSDGGADIPWRVIIPE
ncbi:MAG: hypothetical protein O3B24_05810, partial [Verrucomicrobia bacterium]|nr:hypothetical protein [Verrucomicrobiota bacterium]